MVDDASVNPWALFESIPEMVVVVDNEGTILYSNAHSHDVLGWPPPDLVGQKIEVLIPDRLHPCIVRTAPPTPRAPRLDPWAAVCC